MNKPIRKYWPLFFIYFIICCFRSFQRTEGDIHIYLNAAKMYLNGENIYPYYLYPPPSILMFAPLTFFGDAVGRVIWAVLNFFMFLRLLTLLIGFCKPLLKENFKDLHLFLIIMISIMGMIDHNIQLGQMTILMLWLSLEFCNLLNRELDIKASVLLAIGITIKIIPGIFLLWLWVKKKYAALGIVALTMLGLALLPAIFNGQFSNQNLWLDWITTVNPFGERFGVESGLTVISLNSFLPAYLSDSNEVRNIANFDTTTIAYLVNICRLALFLFLWYLYSRASDKMGILEIAFTLLISVLVFPHQMKYSMLLFTPAMILILINLLNSYKRNPKVIYKIGNLILLLFFLIFSLYGRDTIGDTLVEKLDTSKYFTWLMLVAFVKLLYDEVQISKAKKRFSNLVGIGRYNVE